MSTETFDPDVKLLIEEGRKKGFLTYEEINRVLPDDLVSSEKLDAQLMRMGAIPPDSGGPRGRGALLDALSAATEPPRIVIDGLDEAGTAEAFAIAEDVIRLLAAKAQFLVATRELSVRRRTGLAAQDDASGGQAESEDSLIAALAPERQRPARNAESLTALGRAARWRHRLRSSDPRVRGVTGCGFRIRANPLSKLRHLR